MCILHTPQKQFQIWISPQIFGKNQNCPRKSLRGPGGAIWWKKTNTQKSCDTVPLMCSEFISIVNKGKNFDKYFEKITVWSKFSSVSMLSLQKRLICSSYKFISSSVQKENLSQKSVNVIILS